MSAAVSLRLSVALFLLSATAVYAADDEKDNTDFLLNVFSDIGPILALFGEQFARQFLSETFTWEDHIIFACIPLGIMTAISGAIRVQGGSLFKAVIGRARENHAAAEIEYMSSTSTEVCELYNGEGIVRTMGKPYIGQIIVCPGKFPRGNDLGEKDGSCGVHTLETAEKKGIMKFQDYRVQSRPRFFRWLGSSPVPTKVIQKSARQKTEKQGDPEIGAPRPEDTVHSGWDGSYHENSQKDRNSGKKNPWLTLRSPNLQLNIPCEDVSEHKHRFHLVLAAITALVLQIALLGIAVSTVYFISGFEPEPWGLPCYLGGSVLLFLGMLACSIAIEKRTRELMWYMPIQAAASGQDREEFCLIWVQRSQRVSEQDFGSYVIDGGARKHIMTSSRQEDLEGLGKTRATSQVFATDQTVNTDTFSDQKDCGINRSKLSFLPVLPIIAVLFGGVGFTVQFIGLRGLPWPCAVAQLGAMIIMAIIRAFIRRRLTNPLNNRSVLKEHELDYLAIELVEKNGKLFGDDHKEEEDSGSRWDILSLIRSALIRLSGLNKDQKHQPSTEVLVWKVDTASDVMFRPKKEPGARPADIETELVFRPYHNTTTTESSLLTSLTNNHASETTQCHEGQRAVLVRKRLGDLCQWPNNTSKSALALALSVERFMNEFFPHGLLTKPTDKFTWRIPFSRSHSSHRNALNRDSSQIDVDWINLDVTRDSGTNVWNIDNGQVEAILSLWMAHWAARRTNHLKTEREQEGRKGFSTDWRRAGDGSHVEYCRRIGENRNGVLRRDISWWVNNAVEGLQSEDPKDRQGSHDDTSSGSKESRFSFGFNCVKPLSDLQPPDSSAISISSTIPDSSELPGNSRLPNNRPLSNGPEVSDDPKASEFLVQHSTADLVTVMAQHLFTCFICNIGSLLPKTLLNRADINIKEFVKVESSPLFDLPSSIRAKSGRKLSHRQLTKFVNYAEKQGLGTPDDILLCIVPTFSLFDCLPNNVVLDYDQLIPKPLGSFEWQEQKKKCSHYVNLLDCIQGNNGIDQGEYLSLAAVVNTMEFVYLTALHIAKAEACGATKKTYPEEFLTLLEMLGGFFNDLLRRLSPFYERQGRRDIFKALFAHFKIRTGIDDVWSANWNEREPDKTFMRKIGFTTWHRRVVDLKPERELNLRKLLVDVKDGTERDIFGWTPLHYAAARPELKCKPEKGMDPAEDNLLETILNESIQTHRWADKFRRSPIHIAAAAGNINFLGILLPYLNKETSLVMFKGGVDEMNPLHLAAQGSHKNCSIDVPQRVATEGNHNECIITLLDHRHQDENDTDAWLQSPIQTALINQCYKCTLSLLESENLNFSPETLDEFRKPLLSYLNEEVDEHRSVGRKLLLKHYKKFETRKTGDDDILHLAIKFLESSYDLRGLIQSLKESIANSETDFPVDVTNSRNQTPLYLAVSANKTKLARFLVMSGASSSAKDRSGTSPMILACKRGDAISARILLLDDRYNGEESDSERKTALHHAASSSKWIDDSDCLDIVQRLADVMNSIDVRDLHDKTPLQSAIEVKRSSVCVELLRRKASIKLVDISRLSALNTIIETDTTMETQLKAGLSIQIREETKKCVNDRDKDGNTALHRAVNKRDCDTVDWLMQNMADVHIKNNLGRTPFFEACLQDNCHRFIAQVVDALNSGRLVPTTNQIPQQKVDISQLKSGKTDMRSTNDSSFDINEGDSVYDQSALAWACEKGHQEVVEILLKANAIDLRRKATGYHHYTPLHFALSGEKDTIVKLLLDRPEGSNLLNEQDEYGRTPIQFAILNPDQKCLYQLITHPKAGPKLFSSSELAVVLITCSGDDVQVEDGRQNIWDEKAAEGFLDTDNWTLADIAGKYGHSNLEIQLRKSGNITKTAWPLRPSALVGEHDGLRLTECSATNNGRTTNIDLLYWVEQPRIPETFYLRTKEPIPPNAEYFFFEVKIVHIPEEKVFMIGFCGSDVPQDMLPGWNKGSWAYHADDGGLYEGGGWPVTRNPDHICKDGDVMGCGVNLKTGKGYRTHNGKQLDSGDAFIDPWLKTGKLYPCLGFRDNDNGDKLQVIISLPGPGGDSFESHIPVSK